ncbi:hypothetical protein [Mucilaginibacter flavus]|uniref:hypothetical protein n=1 Tax=Mucilaginibacter flavus TaxID=931504 RepID=UPI0025B4B7FC|nr:hypothetical protein [Mucilaginibacter flavus]MDN3579632.1 hypothetical protein [Mucilaginibacter flavus]
MFEPGGLDTAECFFELDSNIVIRLSIDNEVIPIEDLPFEAESLFANVLPHPVYHINKNKMTIAEIVKRQQKRRNSLLGKIQSFFGYEPVPKEYKPYKIEYVENKLKNIEGQKIIDYLHYPDEMENVLLLLENGYVVTEISIAPQGTGDAGLKYFESIDELALNMGDDFIRSMPGSNLL